MPIFYRLILVFLLIWVNSSFADPNYTIEVDVDKIYSDSQPVAIGNISYGKSSVSLQKVTTNPATTYTKSNTSHNRIAVYLNPQAPNSVEDIYLSLHDQYSNYNEIILASKRVSIETTSTILDYNDSITNSNRSPIIIDPLSDLNAITNSVGDGIQLHTYESFSGEYVPFDELNWFEKSIYILGDFTKTTQPYLDATGNFLTNTVTLGITDDLFSESFDAAGQAGQDIGDIWTAPELSEQALTSKVLQSGGKLVQGALAPVNVAAEDIAEKTGITAAIQNSIEFALSTELGEEAAQEISEWVENNPEAARNLVAGLEVGEVIPVGKILKIAKLKKIVPDVPKVKKLTPNELGKIGEDAVKRVYDIGEKVPLEINGRKRIPDGLTRNTLSEVKNVESLSYTQQLRDYVDFANQNDLSFDLYVRPTTELSGPLQEAIKNGVINLKFIPND